MRTQDEYESVLRIAKLQGFVWARGRNLDFIRIPFPNVLNFYDNKTVTYNGDKKTLYDAAEIIEEEGKLRDAISIVRAFSGNVDRTALSEGFLDSLKLLADTVESQMEEVKQMERLTKLKNGRITYNEKRDPVFECGEFCDNCPTGTAYCRTIKK